MRRSAIYLTLSLLPFLVGGCRLFGKKKADAEYSDAGYDTGAVQSTSTADPYAYKPVTPASDSSYGGGYTSAPAGGSRYHTVGKKETLFSLARTYYNDERRWKDIYEANRSTIGSDPNRILVGQKLVIP